MGHMVKGNGGLEVGIGSPRYFGGSGVSAPGCQSAAYARISDFQNPGAGVNGGDPADAVAAGTIGAGESAAGVKALLVGRAARVWAPEGTCISGAARSRDPTL